MSSPNSKGYQLYNSEAEQDLQPAEDNKRQEDMIVFVRLERAVYYEVCRPQPTRSRSLFPLCVGGTRLLSLVSPRGRWMGCFNQY